MKVEDNYPTPILGISTLAPRNRATGQAGEQINFRSDPVNKLTRRPPISWEYVVGQNIAEEDVFIHDYERNGIEYRYVMDKSSGEIRCYRDNIYIDSVTSPNGYVGPNMVAQTIDDETYFVNTDTIVQRGTEKDIPYYSSMLNVTAALNYSETVTVHVSLQDVNNVIRQTVSYTVPQLGITNPNYDAADAARAVAQVAQQLSNEINTLSDVTAYAVGSCVSVIATGLTSKALLSLEVETGQGDASIVAINSVADSKEGFPKYAIVDTLVRIEPDPTSDDGAYFLKAIRSAEFPSGEIMEEVVWVEGRSPDEPYGYDNTTTPFSVTYDNGFTLNDLQLDAREVGDDDSNKPPDFIDNTIQNISYFQNRLVFLSGSNAIMSETDDPLNFWRQSAVTLVKSDRTSIASSAAGVDLLKQAIPHNRDLLILASNAQFKISGDTAVTPESVSMNLTTQTEVQVNVSPVGMGASVYMPISYGSSAGVQEYSSNDDKEVDEPKPITDHVIGLLEGEIKLMTASANLEMIAVTSTGGPSNRIYIYEQFTKRDGSRGQQSWCYWDLPESNAVVDIQFRRGDLNIITLDGTDLVLKKMKLYSRVSGTDHEVYLDDMLKLSTDGSIVTLPQWYDSTNIVVISGEGTTYPLSNVPHTIDDRTITLSRNVGIGSVYVGKIFRSSYSPTRPFKLDQDGIALFNNKVRISRFYLDLVDTHNMSMNIKSDYYEGDDQEFVSRLIGTQSSLLSTVSVYSGPVSFAYGQDASLADAVFYTESYLGATIAGIGWLGQWTARARGL